MANCIKHQMPDGTIMEGPVHGPGQVCIEYDNTTINRRKSMRRRISSRRIAKRGRPVARRGRPAARRGRASAHIPGHGMGGGRNRPSASRRGGVRRRGRARQLGNGGPGGMVMNSSGQCVRMSSTMGYRRGRSLARRGGVALSSSPSRRTSKSSAFRRVKKLQGP